MDNKCLRLNKILKRPELAFLMEAHNGLSAKIVEETGFEGIWASGLSISASLGVRDNNEASWTQVLDVIEFMSDSTSIPILLDGDTGYGNFNNMRRLVLKLEQRDIAGVCIEDKLFPKTNSFIGEKQPLADIEEFSGKIKAAKDTQKNKHFCVVARVEAFIAGWGVYEAIKRAEAYRNAGADAILIHSKRSDAKEIEIFMREWGNKHPVVIVPTKYYSTPTELYQKLGINMIIWANHNCRASIKAMQEASKKIFYDQSLKNVEGSVTSVQEIFRLQGDEELRKAEKKYLPSDGKEISSIILAASQGSELGDLTKEIPKTLLEVNGKSILKNQVEMMKSLGIKKISVVCGFEKDKIKFDEINKVYNKYYKNSKDLYSLYCAIKNNQNTGTDLIISYGDIIFKEYVLHSLLTDEHEITIAVDADYRKIGTSIDYVMTSIPYKNDFTNEDILLKTIFSKDSHELNIDKSENKIDGEFIGLWKVSSEIIDKIIQILEHWEARETLKEMSITDLLNEIVKNQKINIKFVRGSWIDVDTIYDLHDANKI